MTNDEALDAFTWHVTTLPLALLGELAASSHDAGEKIVRHAIGALERSSRKLAAQPYWLARTVGAFPWLSRKPLSEAACSAGVEHAHFDRTFRRYLDMTPSEFRSLARLRVSAWLLTHTDLSLAEVAASGGYADQSHMTTTFSRSLGVSPGRYRRIFKSNS